MSKTTSQPQFSALITYLPQNHHPTSFDLSQELLQVSYMAMMQAPSSWNVLHRFEALKRFPEVDALLLEDGRMCLKQRSSKSFCYRFSYSKIGMLFVHELMMNTRSITTVMLGAGERVYFGHSWGEYSTHHSTVELNIQRHQSQNQNHCPLVGINSFTPQL